MGKVLIIFALFSLAYGFSEDDITPRMRDNLDSYVEMRNKWAERWTQMSEHAKALYQHVFFDRFKEEIKHMDLENQVHDMVVKIPEDNQHTLLMFLREKFPTKAPKEQLENEIAEIDRIIHEISNEYLDILHDTIEEHFPSASTNYEVSSLYR